jgi:hypothetical protein
MCAVSLLPLPCWARRAGCVPRRGPRGCHNASSAGPRGSKAIGPALFAGHPAAVPYCLTRTSSILRLTGSTSAALDRVVAVMTAAGPFERGGRTRMAAASPMHSPSGRDVITRGTRRAADFPWPGIRSAQRAAALTPVAILWASGDCGGSYS